MKRLLFLIAILSAGWTSVTANVHENRKELAPRFSTHLSRAQVSPADNQVWWGYYKDQKNLRQMGNYRGGQYDACIGIERNNSIVKDTKVTGIRFKTPAKKFMKDVKVWVAEDLPWDGSDISTTALVVQDVKPEEISDDGWSEIIFDTPYQVHDEYFYLGYSFYIDPSDVSVDDPNYNFDARYPIYVTRDGDFLNGIILRDAFTLKYWEDQAEEYPGTNYGVLTIEALIESEDFVPNSASVEVKSHYFTNIGEESFANVTLNNTGTKGISSLGYMILVDGFPSSEITYELPEPYSFYGGSLEVNLPIPATQIPGVHSGTFLLSSVNGKPNMSTDMMSDINLITATEKVDRKTFIENVYSNASGWTPRLMLGMEILEQMYPEKFTQVYIPYLRDPLKTATYDEICDNLQSWPISIVNRIKTADGYWGNGDFGFGFDQVVIPEFMKAAPASIEFEPLVLSNDGRIKINSNVYFQYDSETSPFSIGYLLLMDNWSRSDYKIANDLPDFASDPTFRDDPNFKKLIEGEYDLEGVIMHNIVVDGLGVKNGIEGSLSGSFEYGVPKKHSAEFSISNPVIDDINNLKVLAFLYDNETNEIVNVAVAPVAANTDYPDYSASIQESFKDQFTVRDNIYKFSLEVMNSGNEPISSLGYVVTVNGKESEENSITLEKPIVGRGNVAIVEFPWQSSSEYGLFEASLEITKVNNLNNPNADNKSNGLIYVLAESCPRKTVMEEFTGAWCGWCPRGITAIEILKEMYGDSFIPVSVHYADELQPSGYASILQNVKGYPHSYVDRYVEGDPYQVYNDGYTKDFHAPEMIDLAQSRMSTATVNLAKAEINPETKQIEVETNVTFQYDSDNAPFALGYIVLQNHVKAQDFYMIQNNYYSEDESYRNDPYLEKWIDMPALLIDLVYEDVVIQAFDIQQGLFGSITAPLRAGIAQTHSCVLDLSSNWLMNDMNDLSVVAVLFNNSDGTIENADIVAVTNVQVSNVEALRELNQNEISDIYTLEGIKVPNLIKGINIVKTKDGRTYKIYNR